MKDEVPKIDGGRASSSTTRKFQMIVNLFCYSLVIALSDLTFADLIQISSVKLGNLRSLFTREVHLCSALSRSFPYVSV